MSRVTLPDLKARVDALEKSSVMTIKQDAKIALNDFLTFMDGLDQRISLLESEANNGK